MAGRFLLDTNIVSALFDGDPEVQAHARGQRLCVCSTVLGELFYGAVKGARTQEYLAKIDQFSTRSHVLPSDQRTARIYADIKLALKLSGTPIPENDIWIAAAALQHGLVLATRDQHFQQIAALKSARW